MQFSAQVLQCMLLNQVQLQSGVGAVQAHTDHKHAVYILEPAMYALQHSADEQFSATCMTHLESLAIPRSGVEQVLRVSLKLQLTKFDLVSNACIEQLQLSYLQPILLSKYTEHCLSSAGVAKVPHSRQKSLCRCQATVQQYMYSKA